MKNLFKKTKLVLIALLIVFTYSCSSEDGTDGIDGIDGVDGVDGAVGPQGPQGEPGAVNIIYSEWLPQDFNFQDALTYKAMLVNDVNINDNFLDNGGIVLGFFRYQDNVPYQLPYQDFGQNNIRTITPVHFSDGGNVRFGIQSTDGTDLTASEVNGSGASNPEYKYVLIPGGTLTTGSRSSIDLKKLSYKEVCDYLGIEY